VGLPLPRFISNIITKNKNTEAIPNAANIPYMLGKVIMILLSIRRTTPSYPDSFYAMMFSPEHKKVAYSIIDNLFIVVKEMVCFLKN